MPPVLFSHTLRSAVGEALYERRSVSVGQTEFSDGVKSAMRGGWRGRGGSVRRRGEGGAELKLNLFLCRNEASKVVERLRDMGGTRRLYAVTARLVFIVAEGPAL